MKIAIVTDAIYPFSLGGSEIRNHEIAKRLVVMGHEVHILGSKRWPGKKRCEVDGVKIVGVFPVWPKLRRFFLFNYLHSLALPASIFLFLILNNYDIVDNASFHFFNCYATRLATRIKKVPLVFTWHQFFGDYLTTIYPVRVGRRLEKLEIRTAKMADFNVVIAVYVKHRLTGSGVVKAKITVIGNGVNLGEVKACLRDPHGYDIIFVGRLGFQKNIGLLIDALKILSKRGKNYRTAIVGGGEDRLALKKKSYNLGLDHLVKFYGRIIDRQRIFSLLKSAKVFVLPSRLEGLPLVVLEAHACGLPVVAVKTKWHHPKEYVKTAGDGLIVDDSSDALADGIEKTLSAPRVSAPIPPPDWDDIAKQTLSVYSRLVMANKDKSRSLTSC